LSFYPFLGHDLAHTPTAHLPLLALAMIEDGYKFTKYLYLYDPKLLSGPVESYALPHCLPLLS
jgi:hypothetical protein